MWTLISKIVDLILPKRCKNCGKIIYDDDALCEDCFNQINFISAPYCFHCGMPFEESSNRSGPTLLCPACAAEKAPWFRLCRSAVHYDDASKPLVISFKFYDRTDNARLLAKWLNMAGKDIWRAGVDVLIPVPLHYTRLIKRRYNQSALLAKELSKITGVPIEYSALVKHKRTRPQVEFSGRRRKHNLRGAFKLKYAERIKGKKIVLIDDVLTTGSTLKECAKALLVGAPESIDLLTIARVCKD